MKEEERTELDGQLGGDAGFLDLLDVELNGGVVVLKARHVLAHKVSIFNNGERRSQGRVVELLVNVLVHSLGVRTVFLIYRSFAAFFFP